MNLNHLLSQQDIDPAKVIVMRHSPSEKPLRKVLPWLVHEQTEIFNAYQQKHHGKTENALEKLAGHGWLASFIGLASGQAVYAGLYRIDGCRPVTHTEFWAMPVNQALKDYGMAEWDEEAQRNARLWFNLQHTGIRSDWIGKLIVGWPPPDLSWWRRAHKNDMPVLALLEESRFAKGMPDWQELDLSWAEMKAIPSTWKAALNQWRGIYFIHDTSDGSGYVGSAYGEGNLLGRWLEYGSSGHGGNRLLLDRDPRNFRFSILQRVSPDLNPDEVIRLETQWKIRLHTVGPFGLNGN